MSDAPTWRLLGKDEWDRLEEFLKNTVSEDAKAPDKVLFEVVVLVDSDDQILAAMACGIYPIITQMLASSSITEDDADAVYSSGLEAVRQVCESNGISGSLVFAMVPDAQEHVPPFSGFADTGFLLFVGNV